MSIRSRILLGFFVVLLAALGLMMRWTLADLRLQPKQAMEESLVDLAHILAATLETSMTEEGLSTTQLGEAMDRVAKREFHALIYDYVKDRVNVRVYVTDEKGMVLYDSDDGRDVGKDYSERNDVYLTLHGRYGARSSRMTADDPSTSIMVINAPVWLNGKLVGTVAIAKPTVSVAGFVKRNTRRLIVATGVVFLAAFLMSLLMTGWIVTPIRKLTAYARSVRDGERNPPPRSGSPEIRQLTSAFEDMRDALENRRYVEHYVQTLTHELKSPLSAIRGAVEILQENPGDPERTRFLSHIQTEGERIRLVVDRLLMLTGVESRKWLENPEPVQLKGVTQGVVASLEPTWRTACVALKIAGDDERIAGDRFLVEQAIRNILENAIRFSPVNGRVSVNISGNEKQAILRVSDQGPGIPEYAREKVWDRFYSLPLADGKRGTGLGLPFVKEVMRLHGGNATLSTGPAGTTVTLHFPRT